MTAVTKVEARRLIVMQSYLDPARSGFTNPYKVLLVEALPEEDVRAEYFRWRAALTSRIDVLHVHWPEHLIRSSSRLRQLAKTGAMLLLILRLRVRRTAVVRTVHNVRPHEAAGPFENWVLERLSSLTSAWIVMNDTTPTPDPARTVLIPHGHYRDWYDPRPNRRQRAGSLLTFGLIRHYKGIENFLIAFRSMPVSAGLSLHIAGRPDSAAAGGAVEHIAAQDPRISVDLRYLPDQELVAAIQGAEIVVLPYRDMHNSGSALLALSLNRPIIVPSTPPTEQLVEEFGDEWVVTYDGELNDRTLAAAIESIRARPRSVEGVDMRTRDWSAMGIRLAAVYQDAVARRHGRRDVHSDR